jgi:hypothetical protein
MRICTPIDINDDNSTSIIAEPDASSGEIAWTSPLIGSGTFDTNSHKIIASVVHSAGDTYLIGSPISTGSSALYRIDKEDQVLNFVVNITGIPRTISEGYDGALYIAGNMVQFARYPVSAAGIGQGLSYFGTTERYYYSSCTGADGHVYLSGTEDLTQQFTRINIDDLSISMFGATSTFVPDMVLGSDGHIYALGDNGDYTTPLLKVNTASSTYDNASYLSSYYGVIAAGDGYLVAAGSGSFAKIDIEDYSVQNFGKLQSVATGIINTGDDIFYCSAGATGNSVNTILIADAANLTSTVIEAGTPRTDIAMSGEYIFAFPALAVDTLRLNPAPKAGEQFVDLDTHKIYEAVTTNTVQPSIGADMLPASWVEVSATNKFRAFDYQIKSKSTLSISGGYQFTISPDSPCSILAIFGLKNVETVRIQVWADAVGTAAGGTLLTAKTQSLKIDLPEGDEAEEQLLFDKVIFESIGQDSDQIIRIGFDSVNGNEYEVGAIVLTRGRTIGELNVKTETSRKSYSKVTTNDFGDDTIIKRPSAEYTSFDVSVDPNNAAYVERILDDSLDEIRLFIGDAEAGRIIFTLGFYEVSPLVYDNLAFFGTTIKVRGVT